MAWVLGVIVFVALAGCGESKRGEDPPTSGRGGSSAGVGGSSAGAGATGGSGGSGGSAWNAVCNGVSTNGRCNGDVFEWCDYYTQGLRTFDCASLGMTCQADELQPPETERNGCVGGPCPMGEVTCDNRFINDCANGLSHVTDCEKTSGPGAACVEIEGSHVCLGGMGCGLPSSESCDGTMHVICNENGELRVQDCARCNPAGMCGLDGCTPSIFDCDLP